MEGISIINPFSSRYHALSDFKSLKTSQKIITIALTIIGALATALLGTAAFFRLLVGHYYKVVKPNQGNQNDKPDSPLKEPAKASGKTSEEAKIFLEKDRLSARDVTKVASASATTLANVPISTVSLVGENTEKDHSGKSAEKIKPAASSASFRDARADTTSDEESEFTSADEPATGNDGTKTPSSRDPEQHSDTAGLATSLAPQPVKAEAKKEEDALDFFSLDQLFAIEEDEESAKEKPEPDSVIALQPVKVEVKNGEDALDFSGLDQLFAIEEDEEGAKEKPKPAFAIVSQPAKDMSEDESVEFPENSDFFTGELKLTENSERLMKALLAQQEEQYRSERIRSNSSSSTAIIPKPRNLESADSYSSASPHEAFQAMGSSNVFASREERERACQMAALARSEQFAALGKEELDVLFPKGIFALPSPEIMGVEIPAGFKVEAFRHGEDVIISIQGQDLSEENLTKAVAAMLALGIDRYKSDEELIGSLRKVCDKLKALYGFELSVEQANEIIALLRARIHDETALEKAAAIGKGVIAGAVKGGAIGTFAGGVLGGGVFLGGLALGPVALLFTGMIAIGGALAGGGAQGASEAVKEGVKLAKDGFKTLKKTVGAIDRYIAALKRGYIGKNDTVITTGHGLAGFLSGVVGAINADEAYSFNGPGVQFDYDVKKILENMGMNRQIEGHVEYKSIQMEGDFIGNIGMREASERTLYLPITMGAMGSFPDSRFTSPLAHHGINLMYNVLQNASIAHGLPRELSPNLPIVLFDKKKKRGPVIEEVPA